MTNDAVGQAQPPHIDGNSGNVITVGSYDLQLSGECVVWCKGGGGMGAEGSLERKMTNDAVGQAQPPHIDGTSGNMITVGSYDLQLSGECSVV